MACSWRWFIHPATVIRTNRNGSNILDIWSIHYRGEARDLPQIHFDPVFGPYWIRLVLCRLTQMRPPSRTARFCTSFAGTARGGSWTAMYCPAESRLEKDNLFGLAIFHRHGLAR